MESVLPCWLQEESSGGWGQPHCDFGSRRNNITLPYRPACRLTNVFLRTSDDSIIASRMLRDTIHLNIRLPNLYALEFPSTNVYVTHLTLRRDKVAFHIKFNRDVMAWRFTLSGFIFYCDSGFISSSSLPFLRNLPRQY